MHLPYILGLLAVVICGVDVVEGGGSQTIRKLVKRALLKGPNQMPRRMMEQQKKIDGVAVTTKKGFEGVERSVEKRHEMVTKYLMQENKNQHPFIAKILEEEVQKIMKKKNDSDREKITTCVKSKQRLLHLGLDDNLEKSLKCVNESTEKVVDIVTTARKDYAKKSFSGKDKGQLFVTQWSKCMIPTVNSTCVRDKEAEMNERVKETEKASTENIGKAKTADKDYEKELEECLKKHIDGLVKEKSNYENGLKYCSN